MWMTNLSGNKASVNMFYISGFASLIWGFILYITNVTKAVVKMRVGRKN
jgi:NHS family xanthosine MFS transporter